MIELYLILLKAEWQLCSKSELVRDYDLGDSYYYAEAKRLGVPLSDIKYKGDTL